MDLGSTAQKQGVWLVRLKARFGGMAWGAEAAAGFPDLKRYAHPCAWKTQSNDNMLFAALKSLGPMF